MNLILQSIKALFRKVENKIPKKLSDLTNDLKLPPPDWNQNDSKGEGYIKNRPFYEEYFDVVIVKEHTITIDETGYAFLSPLPDKWCEHNEPFTIVFDGIGYKGITYTDSDALTRTDFVTKDGVPVYIYDNMNLRTSAELAGEHTISLNVMKTVTHIIDEKYLPEQKVRSVNGKTGRVQLTASDIGAATVSQLENKISMVNPSTTGSFSHNRVGSIGQYSVAIGGDSPRATASYASAFGFGASADGMRSIAVGVVCLAKGERSCAFGYGVTATKDQQVAIGRYNRESTAEIVFGIGSGDQINERVTALEIFKTGNAKFKSTVEMSALILRSSTEGSEKKFRIAVDDSGTITATEVV